MLTGDRPFSGDSPDEIMRNVLEVEPPMPSELNADVPPMVDLLVWSMLAKRPFDRTRSAAIVARRLRRLGEEADRALAAHARDEGERVSGDRNVVLMPSHRGDDRAPSTEVLVHLFRDLGEEVDGALAAHARDEGVSATAATTGELASGDRDVALTVDDQGDDRAPSAEVLVHLFRDLGAKVDGALAAHARDEGVSPPRQRRVSSPPAIATWR